MATDGSPLPPDYTKLNALVATLESDFTGQSSLNSAVVSAQSSVTSAQNALLAAQTAASNNNTTILADIAAVKAEIANLTGVSSGV